MCLCDTWYLLFCVDDCLVCIPDGHPHRVTSTKCLINSFFSWWWAHSHPKHVEEIDKYTKNKLCTKLALFTRLYRDARSTKQENHFLAELQLNLAAKDTKHRSRKHSKRMTASLWSAMWWLVWYLQKQKRMIIARDWPILLLLLITG